MNLQDPIDADGDSDAEEHQSRKFIARHCVRRETGEVRYAIKRLKNEDSAEERTFLSIEASFLRRIEHPHVIKLRAVSDGPNEGVTFLILDRLYDTLEKRIRHWRFEVEGSQTKRQRWKNPGGFGQLNLNRLNVVFDLSSALLYLHKMGICHRDIKPDNIGFDVVSTS